MYRKLFLIMPLAIFIFLSTVFYLGLNRENPNELPSALISANAPELYLDAMKGKIKPNYDDLTLPTIKLVNFWASWCGPCRAEHANLETISRLGYRIIGINYKDNSSKAIDFLDELGDPYSKVGSDSSGRTGINWGIYGVPETFIIDNNGIIIMRHAGPITNSVLQKKLIPLLEGNY